MKNFKQVEISNEKVRDMKAQLEAEFDRVCSEDGINFSIKQDTTNGVSFYITFWTGEHPDTNFPTQMRISDHVCGSRKAGNFFSTYREALGIEKKNAVQVIEKPVYHTREVREEKIRDTDTNVKFSRVAKRGHKLFEVRRKMAYKTTIEISRKNGPAKIQMPEGLGVKFYH